jgi:hypothetical protein
MKMDVKTAIYYWSWGRVIRHFDQFKYCLGYLVTWPLPGAYR